MLLFKNWEISATKDIIARQYDNLSCTLLAVGDFPEGYTWDLLIKAGDAMDIITLGPMEGGMGVVLTADQLSLSGYYHMQLRGTHGDVVRHTNVITAFIPASLSGDGQWPAVPSEFTQMEARMRDIAAHPPVPGDNGYWLIWAPNTGEYAESEFLLPAGGGGGEDGGYYAPNIDTEGNLTWTASKAGMPEVPGANITGPQGPVGPQGEPGTDGYTPQRGVDYWTADDQQSIVNDVLTALPTWEGGSY